MPCSTHDAFTFERGQARTRAYCDALDFEHKFREGVRSWRNLTAADDKFLFAVFDTVAPVGYLVASNRFVRCAAQWAMIDGMLELYAADPDKRLHFGTFAWDLGVTSEDRPVINITALQQAVYHVLHRRQLTGFTVVEVDVLRPLPAENYQRLLFHVHCVVWTEAGRFQPRKTAKELMASPWFPNGLGAPSVKFKRIKNLASDYARVGGYLGKLRAEAKRRVPRKNSKFRLHSTTAGFTAPTAVRRIEILSHFSIFELVRGVGKPGRAFVRDWKQRSIANLPPSRGRAVVLTPEEVARSWAKIRRFNGSPRYAPPLITTQASARRERLAAARAARQQ